MCATWSLRLVKAQDLVHALSDSSLVTAGAATPDEGRAAGLELDIPAAPMWPTISGENNLKVRVDCGPRVPSQAGRESAMAHSLRVWQLERRVQTAKASAACQLPWKSA